VIEIKKKSVAPIYGTAAVWVLCCFVFPYLMSSIPLRIVLLVSVGLVTFGLLKKLFPDKTTQIEADAAPADTGDDKVDSLLADGRSSVAHLRILSEKMPNTQIKAKADNLTNITDQIFNKLQSDPNVYNQVKRFHDFYLPTSIKMLSAYESFGQSGVTGDNITGTMEKIDTALDTILESFKKFYDSLFENKALDIETDISVMETMLKSDGLLDSDFNAKQ